MQKRLPEKRKAVPLRSPTRDGVERQLAWAAGTERFRHRDPLYHVTESFRQLFDGIGARHAAELSGGETQDRAESGGRAQTEEPGRAAGAAGAQPGEGGSSTFRPWRGERQDGRAVRTFAETAFQRGKLSAAVLEGSGKMMLISCLQRTVGQSEPVRLQQQTVFGVGSQTRNVPGRDPDRMVFDRGFVNSAVGLVVDTLRDARRTVDSLSDMAQGTGELSERENGTLRAMYPFLDDSRERSLLTDYRRQLRSASDPRERAVLQGGIVHAEALIGRKAQMKNEFINKLREISDRAIEALSELEAPGAADEIWAAVSPEAVSGPEGPPTPPGDPGAPEKPTPPGDPGAAGAPEREEGADRTDAADRPERGDGADRAEARAGAGEPDRPDTDA